MRKRKISSTSARTPSRGADYPLLIACGLVLIFGLLMLSSATSVIAFDRAADSYFFVKQQLVRGVLPGLLFFVICLKLDYRKLKKFGWLYLLITLSLLVSVFVPGLGVAINGVQSWISLGSIVFQPSELAKLSFIVWLAVWLSNRHGSITSFRKTILPFGALVAIVLVLLLLQPDVGTMMVFVLVSFVVLIAANVRFVHLLFFGLVGALSLTSIIAAAPYRLQRILTFWNPEADIQGAGYQLYQSMLAIGSGSWFGLGIGQSRQKFYYVPEIASDSIFAIIGEELGFVFSILLLAVFVFIFLRGVRIAHRAPDAFGALLAIGISSMIALHVLINMGSMLGLLPLTGIPLSFISLGGSNIAILLAALGILANISKYQEARHD